MPDRLEPQEVDAGAGVDGVDPHPEQRQQAARIVARDRGGDGLPFHDPVAAMRLEPQHTRAAAAAFEPCTKLRRHPLQRQLQVGRQPDRVGKGHPHREAFGRRGGVDRLGRGPRGLVEPVHQPAPEAPG